MKLPDEIHEITRWHVESGDVLILRNTECEVDQDQSNAIKRIVRVQLALPDDVEIMVLGRDWEVSAGKRPA